ncbi:hypothetical protein LPTSP2_37760 [Leptospira ellinghausenii]|uniref:Uncharacterized protein n=1 Tax=Leptospira ellinghausenii TaxID=1917822 RepID=A0A2P2DII2_9LEPT|nr:hypothetical protein LPTSP2_37760 [Leptospira ellinghausenii]
MKDGEITSPFAKDKETDKKVCAVIYLYCDEQFRQCVNPPENQDFCSRTYQNRNNTVRGCILN